MAQYTDKFSSGWATLIVNISESGTSPITNKGTISYSMYIKKTSSYATSYNSGSDVSIYLNIGGKRRYTGSSFDIRSLSVGSSKKICSGSFTVEHDENGELSLAVSARFTSGVKLGSASLSRTFTGTPIPRASSIESITPEILAGGTVDITLAKKVETFRHTVKVALGNYSLTEKDVNTSASFEIPLEWANAIATSTSAVAKATVTTYSGETQIGSAVTTTFTVNVPDTDEFYPKINEVTVAEAVAAVTDAFGERFVQNVSQLNISIDASGAYSSTIKGFNTVLDGVSYVSRAFTSNVIKTAGTIEATVKVTDSRGRTAKQAVQIDVVEYVAPVITAMTYSYFNPDGTEQVKLKIIGAVSSVENQNTKNLKLKYRKMSDDTYTERLVAVTEWNFSEEVIIPADSSVTYEFVAELVDKIDSSTYTVKTGVTVLSRFAGGEGITLFGEAEEAGFVIKGDNPIKIISEAAKAGTRQNINVIGFNPITSTDEDIPANWKTLGSGYAYIGGSGRLVNQPSTYGIVQNMVYGNEVRQMWFGMYNGDVYHRGGHSTSGWTRTWKRMLDNSNTADYPVEVGTDSTGKWIYRKWESGLAECWCQHNFTGAIDTASGEGYRSDSVKPPDFPENLFVDIPKVNIHTTGNNGYLAWVASAFPATLTNAGSLYLMRTTTCASRSWAVSISAVGKWKSDGSVELTATHDGAGNVTLYGATATHDGNGNVTLIY